MNFYDTTVIVFQFLFVALFLLLLWAAVSLVKPQDADFITQFSYKTNLSCCRFPLLVRVFAVVVGISGSLFCWQLMGEIRYRWS